MQYAQLGEFVEFVKLVKSSVRPIRWDYHARVAGAGGSESRTGTTSWVEVTENPNGFSTWIIDYSPVPLASRIMHVNGRPDVKIDTVNGSERDYYGTDNLSAATYDPATKTCSNVSCHHAQTKVKWGAPNRMDEGVSGAECDQCHRMGYLNGACTP